MKHILICLDVELRMSTSILQANDIKHAVGLLTVRKGLGLSPNDPEMNFIIDPTIPVEDYTENEDIDLDDIRIDRTHDDDDL